MSRRDVLEDRHTVGLAAVLVVAAALRLYALGRESLWMDEVYSVTDAVRFTTVELLTVLPVVKNHGPAYYVLLRGWIGVAGLSEAMLRLPTALAGIATVAVVYAVGAELFDRETGLLSAALLALSPFHVAHSQAVRMYGFVGLLTALSFYFLVRLGRTDDRRWIAGYVLATALLVYTHPYGVFVILAGNAYVWWRLGVGADVAHTARRWVATQAALGALLLPYGLVLVDRLLATAGGTYTPLDWRSPPGASTLLGTPIRYLGYPIHSASLLVGVPVVVALVGLAVLRISDGTAGSLRDRVRVRAADREAASLLGVWLVVPVAVPAALSYLLSPIYGVRYTIGASLALFVLLARGLTRIERHHLRYAAVAALVVALVAPLPAYYAGTTNEEWREATTYVAEGAEPGDLVLFTDADGSKPWDVYVSRDDLVTREVPDDGAWRNLSVSPACYGTVWVLNRTYPTTNDNEPASVVLDDTHRRVTVRSYYGVEAYRFERRASTTCQTDGG